jgi:hypothetical protein
MNEESYKKKPYTSSMCPAVPVERISTKRDKFGDIVDVINGAVSCR